MNIYKLNETLNVAEWDDSHIDWEELPDNEHVANYNSQWLRDINLGVPKSKEHRKKLSLAQSKNRHTEKTKTHISKTMKGNTNSKNHSSDEYRKKHSMIMKKAWERRKLKNMPV